MQLWTTGSRLIDPGHDDGYADSLVNDGKITRIVEYDPAADEKQASNNRHSDLRIIDAANKIVTPGLIDMHVHLRQPGQEHKETIETGCRAAAWGGFSAVCCMPIPAPSMTASQLQG